MEQGWFSPPVTVIVRSGITDHVNSALKAAELLYYHWPQEARDSEVYRAAVRACIEAVENGAPAGDARAAFQAAAEEAGVLRKV